MLRSDASWKNNGILKLYAVWDAVDYDISYTFKANEELLQEVEDIKINTLIMMKINFFAMFFIMFVFLQLFLVFVKFSYFGIGILHQTHLQNYK